MTEIYPASDGCYDEMFNERGAARPECQAFVDRLREFPSVELQQRQSAAETSLRDLGVTFNVYGHEAATEKVWPFDLLPRIVAKAEWDAIRSGLEQRVRALNLFVNDVYNDRRSVADGIIPEELVATCTAFREQLKGFQPPRGVWCHIGGVDLVRHSDGQVYVLEDNLRCPSGVSYVLENRELMKRTFPQVFDGMSIAPVEDYPERLLDTLVSCSSRDTPTAVLLTPGIYNSAYFEHTFLAQQMGVELVQGQDLVVEDDYVFMFTTKGLQRVDVIYRRIDDDFLDPACFRSDSVLGVRGLMQAYLRGNVALANAPGAGVADDKAIYAYVPEIIRYFLGEDPILANVPTYVCSDRDQCSHVLANLADLVVKPVAESGGYGIVLGPMASQQELAECADRVRAAPRNYIAQPMLQLSTAPTLVAGGLRPRHVDLRPFVLCGRDVYIMPGGLTRVALREGSMVVNSSQGGGSKDTWVLTRNGGIDSDDSGGFHGMQRQT